MKKVLAVIICILFLTSCTEQKSPKAPRQYTEHTEEFRAVWISYYDLQSMDTSSEETFKKDVNASFEYIKDFGLNTVIVQVRPFADAIYPSEFFPWSKYISEHGIPEYDPLKAMIEIADSYNLSFHAWINPYRISGNSDIDKLPPDSPALNFINKKDSTVVMTDKGIYFNPASLSAQSLIINGVREIIENYKIDAIHIDDYFYPTTDESFDSVDYANYVSKGGNLSLSDWRRENVNSLISGIYSAIKSHDKSIEFGISPGGNIKYDYNSLYADVELWCSSNSYADYIIPQIYFGFLNSSKPFKETAEAWSELVNNSQIKLYGGLALYKSGEEDSFSIDDNAKNEWKNHNDIIKRQIEFLRKNVYYSGFALFSLRNLTNNSNKNLKTEVQNIRSVL